MGSVAGNEGSRSAEGHDVALQHVPLGRSTRGAEPAVAVAVALVLAIGILVAKPWSSMGPTAPVAPTAGIPGQAVASVPASSATPIDHAPDLLLGPDRAPLAGASPPPDAYVENLAPIEPDRWAHLSAGLRTANADGVVFVARYPEGLYHGYLPVTPSHSALPMGPRTDGLTNSVRATGYLGNPVAIGLTRPTGSPAPVAVGWKLLGPGREVRLTLRHPVGDLDRYLYLGPGLGLPPGERRNRREISRWPPVWQAGLYRFDLTTEAGTLHLFVVLEP